MTTAVAPKAPPKSPGKKEGGSTVPGFLAKAYDIFDDPANQDICGWGEDGDTVIIKKFQEFGSLVLTKYFKHGNVASFVRQLNMYGFHKTKQDPSHGEFKHELFRRGRREDLHLIKRKQVSQTAAGQAGTFLKESDEVVQELVKLKEKQKALEEKLQEVKIENETIATENEMLWGNLQQHVAQQKHMQEKMGRILRAIYEIFTHAGLTSSSQLRTILGNSGLLTADSSSSDNAGAITLAPNASGVSFVEELDSLDKALDPKALEGQIIPWAEGDSNFKSNIEALGLGRSFAPPAPNSLPQGPDALRRLFSNSGAEVDAAILPRPPKRARPAPGGQLIRTLSVEGQDIANNMDQLAMDEDSALFKIDSLGHQLTHFLDGEPIISLDSLGPVPDELEGEDVHAYMADILGDVHHEKDKVEPNK